MPRFAAKLTLPCDEVPCPERCERAAPVAGRRRRSP